MRKPSNRHSFCALHVQLSKNLVDLRREVEIFLAQAAGIISGERERDLAPENIDIGMVAGRLGEKSDLSDKANRAGERGKLECLADRIALARPVDQVLDPRLDLRL